MASSRNAVRLRRRRRSGVPFDGDPELDGAASNRRETASRAIRLVGRSAACGAHFIDYRAVAGGDARRRALRLTGRLRGARSRPGQEQERPDRRPGVRLRSRRRRRLCRSGRR